MTFECFKKTFLQIRFCLFKLQKMLLSIVGRTVLLACVTKTENISVLETSMIELQFKLVNQYYIMTTDPIIHQFTSNAPLLNLFMVCKQSPFSLKTQKYPSLPSTQSCMKGPLFGKLRFENPIFGYFLYIFSLGYFSKIL